MLGIWAFGRLLQVVADYDLPEFNAFRSSATSVRLAMAPMSLRVNLVMVFFFQSTGLVSEE